jgi:MFS family permease
VTSLTSNEHGTFYWHYAWVIVAVIAGMQMVGTSIRMAFGVFIEPLSESYGWSQSSITLAYALSSIVTALASPLAGSLGDRFGARNSMIIGTILYLAGMILTGYMTTLWQLYLTYGLFMGVAQAIFLVPLIPSAMTWFRRHLGLGMGIIMASWGIGPALSAPLIGFLLERYGWSSTFLITGVISAAFMTVLIVLFRNRPMDRGVDAYGTLPGDARAERTKPTAQRIHEFASHIKSTSAYWNMSSIHFLGCVGHAIVIVYIIPLAVYQGISLVAATGAFALLSATSVPSRLFTPVFCERWGVRRVMMAFYILQAIPVLLLFWTHDLRMLYLFAAMFGIGYGGETGAFPILNRRYYGDAPMGTPHGFQMFGAGLGMAFGGWVGGVVFDMFGGYEWALVISVAASLAGAVSIALLERPNRLLIPDWSAEQIMREPQPPPVHELR